MYRCEVCQAVSQPRQKLLRHIIHRFVPNPFVPRDNGAMPLRSEIAREYAVCEACLGELRGGVPLAQVQHLRGREKPGTTAPAPRQAYNPLPDVPVAF